MFQGLGQLRVVLLQLQWFALSEFHSPDSGIIHQRRKNAFHEDNISKLEFFPREE